MPCFSPYPSKKEKMYYEVFQPGNRASPVLLAHCWTGNLDFYRAVLPLLPQDRSYVLLDLPGHGRSDSFPPYSPAHFAFICHQLIKHLGFSKVIMGGHSLGGMTSLAFAARYPEQTEALLLFHTTAFLRGFSGQREIAPLAYLAMHLTPKLIWGVGIGLTSVHPCTGLGKRISIALSCMKTSREVTLKTMKEILRFDGRAFLKALSCPVLIVAGSADVYTDLRHALFLQRKIKRSSLKILPFTGHMGKIENPHAFAKAVTDFLKELC